MAYKIIDIQGIGEAYAPKLIAIGIKTPEELLEACLTPSARKKVAEETGDRKSTRLNSSHVKRYRMPSSA